MGEIQPSKVHAGGGRGRGEAGGVASVASLALEEAKLAATYLKHLLGSVLNCGSCLSVSRPQSLATQYPQQSL